MRVEGKPIQAVTVARLIEYLQSCPQNLPVAFCLYSEQQLLQLEQIAVVHLQPARPDGWVHSWRSDKPVVEYLLLPGN